MDRVRVVAAGVEAEREGEVGRPGVAQIASRLARPSFVSIIAIKTISSLALAT